MCPMCGLVLDRDVNAARNILKRGLEIGLGKVEYTHDGGESTTRLSVDVQAASMNQKAHRYRGG